MVTWPTWTLLEICAETSRGQIGATWTVKNQFWRLCIKIKFVIAVGLALLFFAFVSLHCFVANKRMQTGYFFDGLTLKNYCLVALVI
jgi:hypothetical protein